MTALKDFATDIKTGLSDEQILTLRIQYGYNNLDDNRSSKIISMLAGIVKEPMFILLFVACALYFFLGEKSEGLLMLAAIILVAAISFYQDIKSTNAIKALNDLTEPKVTLLRNGQRIIVSTIEILPGDIMFLEEGMKVPADATLLEANDLTVNEAVITGESVPVEKHVDGADKSLYMGTTVNTGKCTAGVTAIGNKTTLGKLGQLVNDYQSPKTILELQLNRFVSKMAMIGLISFLLILLFNYLIHHQFISSVLFALTMAMSVIPEEIPVAFSSFMALGAYKMSRFGIISRQPQVIENLGAVTVVCLDKTGTITENIMQVKVLYDFEKDCLIDMEHATAQTAQKVLYYGMLASEQNPFDAMEQAICRAYNGLTDSQPATVNIVHEYALAGSPPMMTHVYQNMTAGTDAFTAAAKGAGEHVLAVCNMAESTRHHLAQRMTALTSKGYRVLGVARAHYSGHVFPENQDDFEWQFVGLLALYDPPRKNIKQIFETFREAHIKVKIITGDHPGTAVTIANQTGLSNPDNYVTGEEVMRIGDFELKRLVASTNVFARMFPEAKLRVIEALKQTGEVVAMTGDGVNDGPALKAADIGVAMGRKGTEIARQASDLVLTDDNLEHMAIAIKEGRKIFSNLKKAVRYIISIHVPIILTASLPVIFGWTFPNIFTPIHVIFLELIMGPTCSIFFEKEPVENNIMQLPPRQRTAGLFSNKELATSIFQGLIIAAGSLGLYYYFMTNGASLEVTRTIVFTNLLLSNIFLTFSVRSFSENIFTTWHYKNSLAVIIIILSIVFLVALHTVPAIQHLFDLTNLSILQFGYCLLASFACVIWFEIYKTFLQKKTVNSAPVTSPN